MDVHTPVWMWWCFGGIVIALLAVDLGIANRRSHVPSTREVMAWLSVWVSVAVLFGASVFFFFGPEKALQFGTGYIVEQALSVDNLFVFILIFDYFRVPRELQHRVLFWGILGAFILRAIFIFAGTALVSRFEWVLYLFGAFLVFTGVKLLLGDDEEPDMEKNGVVRFFRRFLPVTNAYEGQHFLVRQGGKLLATPLLLVLLVVEGSDVVFAVDSIPAIFGVTTDPFIVYTSNIFAILGLRNLYFVVAAIINRFAYLQYGLGLVLAFIGAKMLFSHFVHVPIYASLGVIVALLGGSVAVSLLWAPKK